MPKINVKNKGVARGIKEVKGRLKPTVEIRATPNDHTEAIKKEKGTQAEEKIMKAARAWRVQ